MVRDCYIGKQQIFKDCRGYFSEIYKKTQCNIEAKQINISYSKKHTIRGIHRTPYAKVVQCIKGSIYDVCLDLRTDSETYLQHQYVILSEKNNNFIYIPPFCGHAFLALKNSLVIYYQSEEYNKNLDETYCYRNYNIEWPININYISDKDKNSCRNST